MAQGDEALIVFDLESADRPVPIGLYLRTEEDIVWYEDRNGRERFAPQDCVSVSPMVETGDGEIDAPLTVGELEVFERLAQADISVRPNDYMRLVRFIRQHCWREVV